MWLYQGRWVVFWVISLSIYTESLLHESSGPSLVPTWLVWYQIHPLFSNVKATQPVSSTTKSVLPPFPLVSFAHPAKWLWHISRSLSCPKQPLYQNYPAEENQFVYLWRVLHIRHFKPRLACSFTENSSAGLKHVEEVDRCQQAKDQI